MSKDNIAPYKPGTEITAYIPERRVAKVDPVFRRCMTYASKRSITDIVINHHNSQIWMASSGGVSVWDRNDPEQSYRRFASEHGLVSNHVSTVCLDHENRPWTGHYEGGISYYDKGIWHVYNPPGSSRYLEKICRESIRIICGCRQGVWVTTANAIYRIRDPHSLPSMVGENNDAFVQARAALPDNDSLLVGNAWGLYKVNENHSYESIESDRVTYCSALVRDFEGSILIATRNSIYGLKEGRLVALYSGEHESPSFQILDMSVTGSTIWVLSTEGLAILAEEGLAVINRVDSSDTITKLAVGSPYDKYLWIGTNQSLVSVTVSNLRWDKHPFPLQAEDALCNVGRCSICIASDSRVIIGTANNLVVFRPDDTWECIQNGSDYRAICSSSTNSEQIYVLAWPGGIYILSDAETLNHVEDPELGVPVVITVGNDGNCYTITTTGLWRINGNVIKKIGSSLSYTATCLIQTHDRNWWAGTSQGLFRRNKNNEWQRVVSQPGLLDSRVNALLVIENTLWVATSIGLWSQTNEIWKLHIPNSDLCDEHVSALGTAKVNPGIWIAFLSGIVHYDPISGKSSKMITTSNSGLGSSRVVAIQEHNNTLWVSTEAGISRFDLSNN